MTNVKSDNAKFSVLVNENDELTASDITGINNWVLLTHDVLCYVRSKLMKVNTVFTSKPVMLNSKFDYEKAVAILRSSVNANLASIQRSDHTHKLTMFKMIMDLESPAEIQQKFSRSVRAPEQDYKWLLVSQFYENFQKLKGPIESLNTLFTYLKTEIFQNYEELNGDFDFHKLEIDSALGLTNKEDRDKQLSMVYRKILDFSRRVQYISNALKDPVKSYNDKLASIVTSVKNDVLTFLRYCESYFDKADRDESVFIVEKTGNNKRKSSAVTAAKEDPSKQEEYDDDLDEDDTIVQGVNAVAELDGVDQIGQRFQRILDYLTSKGALKPSFTSWWLSLRDAFLSDNLDAMLNMLRIYQTSMIQLQNDVKIILSKYKHACKLNKVQSVKSFDFAKRLIQARRILYKLENGRYYDVDFALKKRSSGKFLSLATNQRKVITEVAQRVKIVPDQQEQVAIAYAYLNDIGVPVYDLHSFFLERNGQYGAIFRQEHRSYGSFIERQWWNIF